MLLVILFAVVFAASCVLAWFLGFHRNLREHFPEDPPIARVLRFGDTVLGLLEQIVLFSLVAFLVFVTAVWFAGDHPMPTVIAWGVIAAAAGAGMLFDRKHFWELLTVLGVAIGFGAGAAWVWSTGKPLEGGDYDVRYTCFLLAMVGGAFAAHHRRLLAMDFVSHFLSARGKPWARIVNTTFGAGIAALFVKFGYRIYESQTAERLTRGAQEHWMPEATANAAMLVGATLLLVHLVIQIVIDLDYVVRGKIPPEPQMGAA